ncbi:ABC transporter substrate-binding protein [Halorubrum vacuolatum]|uniref:Carbohydrate ABC transporter substrate-binding protein, CUT1 family n=1 Tax=Halorubrum vacuolatum TaxID=63740 RepID=A0A238XN91_HALVU|nr:extracellular solute-binding protein [Halorubrum vacuolatum]SNR60021.1 carbohydrate ABC transporter substrate-binding protein, CUT1 family [Halorubrum vacuolatum]
MDTMSNDHTGGYNRRRLLQGSAALGLAAFAGCVGTEPDDDNGADDADDGADADGMADEIDVWGWDIAARAMMLTAEEYEAEHGGTINVEEFGREAMKEDLRSRLTAGSGAPDVAMLEMIDGPAEIDTGAILEISDRLDEAGIEDDFVEGAWASLTDDDGAYAIPWDIGPTAVYYRRDVYDEHGLEADAIETWDDFIEEGQKLPDDVYMTEIPENDLDGVWRYQFRQLGNRPFTEDGEVNIYNDDSIQIAETIKRLYDEDVGRLIEGWSPAWFDAYGAGDIASLPSAAWMEGTLRDELPETDGLWGVYRIPAHEEGGPRASNWGGSSLMIPSQIDGAERDRAWDFITWTLATDEMQLLMYDEYGLFPALETTYENEEVFDEELDFYDGQPARRLFADVAEEMPEYEYSVNTPEVSDAINNHFFAMLRDDLDPEEAVENAAEEVADRTDRELA